MRLFAAAGAGQSLKVLDFAASRKTATSRELAQYSILHFATAGLADQKHPELSGLVLSLVDQNGATQGGFLSFTEIYNLDLPVKLVVLSASETGLGKQIDGEGLIGLSRGFMCAGADRVISSLWKVDDAATAELMRRFYEAMEKEDLTPAAALRKAQFEMWQQERWRAPYYWTAFQIQGEWK
jgi:CHAT domain-containing protein